MTAEQDKWAGGVEVGYITPSHFLITNGRGDSNKQERIRICGVCGHVLFHNTARHLKTHGQGALIELEKGTVPTHPFFGDLNDTAQTETTFVDKDLELGKNAVITLLKF